MSKTIQQLFDLRGKTALVTGGSRGLGLQMAHALGEAGARVLLSSRKASDLEESAAELKAAGIDAQWIAADCAKDSEIQRLADEGKGVIVISSELPELIGICDRIYALAEGRITGEVTKDKANPELLMKYMTTEKGNK